MFSAANMASLAAWLLHPATATLETSSKLLDTRYWHLPSFVMCCIYSALFPSWLLETLTAGCRLLPRTTCPRVGSRESSG